MIIMNDGSIKLEAKCPRCRFPIFDEEQENLSWRYQNDPVFHRFVEDMCQQAVLEFTRDLDRIRKKQ